MNAKICKDVKQPIEQLFPEVKNLPVSFDEDLKGFFNSLKFVSFIVAIEKKYGFSISDDDFVVNKFSTISKISDLINEYMLKQKGAWFLDLIRSCSVKAKRRGKDKSQVVLNIFLFNQM